ncbi:ribosomal protein PSRP-3/Ycf65, partial [Striga asiatica]
GLLLARRFFPSLKVARGERNDSRCSQDSSPFSRLSLNYMDPHPEATGPISIARKIRPTPTPPCAEPEDPSESEKVVPEPKRQRFINFNLVLTYDWHLFHQGKIPTRGNEEANSMIFNLQARSSYFPC